MRESIFYVAMRSFFSSFFTLLGLGVGFLAVLTMLALFNSSELEPEAKFNLKIVPNAEGVRKNQGKDSPVILKINLVGVIGGEEINMKNVREMMVESRENSLKEGRVKAILLNIESPGGTVVDADGIYHALKAYKEQYKVPVYAYVDGLCASGGMYIACAADKIYASDVSLIGSVGVIIPSFVNISTLLDKVGISSLTLFAGKGKDELNPLRPWTSGEQTPLQEIVNTYYKNFVEIVASNRPIDKKKLVEEYGANIYPAKQAVDFGYVDGSGLSYADTLKLLLKELKIEDDHYQVVEMESKTWYNTLFNSESPLFTGKIKHQFQLTAELDPAMANQFLYLYQPG